MHLNTIWKFYTLCSKTKNKSRTKLLKIARAQLVVEPQLDIMCAATTIDRHLESIENIHLNDLNKSVLFTQTQI